MPGKKGPWAPDPRLVQEVRDQFDKQIETYRTQDKYIVEHANHEELIVTGGYANRTLLELVQNAADALSGTQNIQSGSGRIEIVLDAEGKTFYCANAGRPFSIDGLIAVTMAHIGTKRGDEIGRFGLGFKSVLSVCRAPQVISRSVSFEFNSPEAHAALSRVAPHARRYPILRTPTLLDGAALVESDPILAELAEWATTIVRLPDCTHLDRLTSQMRSFNSEFLLFVDNVQEVKLRILGPDPFETSHLARDLGDDIMRVERPDGSGDEWFVKHAMHAPSADARKEVGEAVSRAQIKVTVALPARHSQRRIGEFWSYFPLQDRTSATALFNAPWSVDDNRITLLRNDYNREIIRTLAAMFVDLLPRVQTREDPAAHLDYLPARGREREVLSFGDELLIGHVPVLAAKSALIPNADNILCNGEALRPLDFRVSFDASIHEAWSESPNTGDDVPSWRCYTTRTRVTRLRDLFTAAAVNDAPIAPGARDLKRALELLPKRGLRSWLREWAEGEDPVSAANAFRVASNNRSLPGADEAQVIPTTEGLCSIADHATVFISRASDIQIDRARFIASSFLEQPGVEELLRKVGFRDLDPQAVLNARIAQLSSEPTDEELTLLWDAALDVPVPVAVRTMGAHKSLIRVPTQDGSWAPPHAVLDVDESLAESFPSESLDRTRCLPDVAVRIGVIQKPVKDFALDRELAFAQYEDSILTALRDQQGPGERPVSRIEFLPGVGPGPVSVLLLLKQAGASAQARADWTTSLLSLDDQEWTCEDLDSGRVHVVMSPLQWATQMAGLVKTSRGFLPPQSAVAPSLVKFEGLLPLLKGTSRVAEALALPTTLEDVPAPVLREALAAELFPASVTDQTLVEFLLTASRVAYPESQPPSIPARVRRSVEARPPAAVYLAITDEQQDYLSARHRPYLRVSEEEASALVTVAGCRRFEDSFAFSVITEGLQDAQRVIDVFPGLRGTTEADRVAHATVTRTGLIIKRVTTEDGVEDQTIPWHLDGPNLFASSDADERQLIRFVSDAFGLRLDNAELSAVLKASLDHRLEQLRTEASAASDDASKLDVYFGPDDLRDALPSGLWHALEAQGLVDGETSVSELFLTVYGSDSVRQLQENFRELGFPDVPNTWAGRAPTISWLRRMGFGAEYAGRRTEHQDDEFLVPGAIKMNPLHDFQEKISQDLRSTVETRDAQGRFMKVMVELPTGAGKTRIASETVLRLFIDGRLQGPVLWIAQSQELCEQAVQTWSTVWRGLRDERPLAVGRLWENKTVHAPDTEFSVIVATDAKLNVIVGSDEYEWLRDQVTLVIVDEGHRAGDSPMYTRILDWLGVAGTGWKRPLIGLSATPFKGTSESATLALARRFGNHIIKAFEGNAYQELADRGVLARVKHDVLPGIKVQLTSDEVDQASRLRRINPAVLDRIGRDQARMAILIEHILRQDRAWPILVFTPNVLSAQVLAASLRYRRITAAAVSGQTGRQERRDSIERFKGGDIKVLANCDLLIQGFDAPGVRALYIARPTFSPNAYIQMAGRGLRGPANGGKEECLIVDMADDFGDMSRLLGYRDYEPLWNEQTA